MENNKTVSKKTLYVACGTAVTIGMVVIKLLATAVNKAVAVLLEVE